MTRRNAGPVYLLEIIEVLCLIYVRISAVKCVSTPSVLKLIALSLILAEGGKKSIF